MGLVVGEKIKSSFSIGTGACVQVEQQFEGDIAVSHSKDPDVRALHFERQAWTDFLSGVKAGEFDPA